jgi:hypothetical protein
VIDARERRDRLLGDVLFGVALFTVALFIRVRVASELAGEPVWDGHYYDFGARRIAEGLGYSDDLVIGEGRVWHPWCHYPVGYSAYLAVFYKWFGATAHTAHVANGLVGALLAVVTFLLGREALSPARARVAGVLVAVHPGLVLYSALLMSEPLSALLALAAFWVAVRVARSAWAFERPWAGPCAGALVLGVAALVRPQALLCAPFLAIVAPPRLATRTKTATAKRLAALAVVASAVSLVPVLPWTARNCRVMDGCALVSTNAGWNLAIGSFPRATGRFETLRSSDGCREVTGQVQQDRCWLAYGVRHIVEEPGRWLGLVPKKLAYTFDQETFAVDYLREARPAAWPDERASAWRAALTAFHRLLVVASVLAFVARSLGAKTPDDERAHLVHATLGALVAVVALRAFLADEPAFWPLVVAACALPFVPLPGAHARPPALVLPIVLVGTTALAHAVFFGENRYHVAVTPALCLLAAAALRPLGAHKTLAAREPGGARAAGSREGTEAGAVLPRA